MLRELIGGLVVLAALSGCSTLHPLRASAPVPPDGAHEPDPISLRALPGGGELMGFTGRYGSHVWLGIPYAEAPVGERRWRAPLPPAAWRGVRPALAFGSHCPQVGTLYAGIEESPSGLISGSEDCLYLNVYAPRMDAGAATRARLPVMVWIHGGGNVVGRTDFFDGGRLAQGQDVMVVTVAYRLGPLGWFRHAALREGASPAERSGNFAILDLIRALEWVRENAAVFGGDPGNVTIFGESAGGANVILLLLSPRAKGLFQRAISESGGLWPKTLAEAENFHDASPPGDPASSNEVLAGLLMAEGRAAGVASAKAILASMSPAEIASYLRSRTPRQLLAIYQREIDEGMVEVPQMFADGVVVPQGDPMQRFARADGWNRVPVMLGTNRDEQKLFMFLNPLYVRWWLGLLPQVRDPDRFLATADARSALWKATGADGPAAAIAKADTNVFVYRFDWDEEPSLFGVELSRYIGASHFFEVPFVFGHWDLGRQGNVLYDEANRAGREELAAGMMSYWARFARSGDPGRGARDELPAWTAWDGRPQGHKYMILDTEAGGGLRMGSEPVTVASVLASVEADPRLTSQRDRCGVYRELAAWGGGFGPRDYPTAGRDGCAEFPFESFPWD